MQGLSRLSQQRGANGGFGKAVCQASADGVWCILEEGAQ